MTGLVKWILGTIAMVMAYVTLLISANNAFAVPTKGELRSIVIEKTKTSLPNCSRELQRLGTVGDYSWCKTNIQVIHSFRHSMRNRLRAVNCPSDMIDQIGGWSSGKIGEGYGEGFKMSQLHVHLLMTGAFPTVFELS